MSSGFQGNYLLIFSDFNETLNLLRFSKSTQISNFMKSPPVGAKLFHADRYDQDNSCFSQFCQSANETSEYTNVTSHTYEGICDLQHLGVTWVCKDVQND